MTVRSKTYELPPPDIGEIFRYMKSNRVPELRDVVAQCLSEAERVLTPRVCYEICPVSVTDHTVAFPGFTLESGDLARALSGYSHALCFAATVGVGIDRLIRRYGTTSPLWALCCDAIGDERIEALCDTFCREMTGTPGGRYSPGYGDLPLTAQKELFGKLEPSRHIALTLTDSLLMVPTKSVTAIKGVTI